MQLAAVAPKHQSLTGAAPVGRSAVSPAAGSGLESLEGLSATTSLVSLAQSGCQSPAVLEHHRMAPCPGLGDWGSPWEPGTGLSTSAAPVLVVPAQWDWASRPGARGWAAWLCQIPRLHQTPCLRQAPCPHRAARGWRTRAGAGGATPRPRARSGPARSAPAVPHGAGTSVPGSRAWQGTPAPWTGKEGGGGGIAAPAGNCPPWVSAVGTCNAVALCPARPQSLLGLPLPSPTSSAAPGPAAGTVQGMGFQLVLAGPALVRDGMMPPGLLVPVSL